MKNRKIYIGLPCDSWASRSYANLASSSLLSLSISSFKTRSSLSSAFSRAFSSFFFCFLPSLQNQMQVQVLGNTITFNDSAPAAMEPS